MAEIIEVNGKRIRLNKSGVWYYGEEYIITGVDISNKMITTKSFNNDVQIFSFDFFSNELGHSYFDVINDDFDFNKTFEQNSHQPKFKPRLIEMFDDTVSLHFNKGDISTTIHKEIYTLQNSGVRMDIRICNQKVLNKDNFIFKSETGKQISYHAMQVKALFGINKLFNDVVSDFVSNEVAIEENNKSPLMDEIMNYHSENIINKYLEERNFDGLKKYLG